MKYPIPNVRYPAAQIVVFIIFLSGCQKVALAQQKPLVLATTSIFRDMTKNIAGDAVEVRTIVPIGEDPHIYQPTPGDAQLAATVHLILRNDITYEPWLDELLAHSSTTAKIVTLTDRIQLMDDNVFKRSTDPHAWMDATLGLIYIENIKNALIELVPTEKPMFEFNYGVYRQQLQDLDTYIQQQIQSIPEKRRILFTAHEAFQYYGRRYGIQVEAVRGTSTNMEIQAAHLTYLNKKIQKIGVPAIFLETTVNPEQIQKLVRQNQIESSGKLYSDSVGDTQSPASSYLDLLKYNTDTIVKVLLKNVDVTTEKMLKPRMGLLPWGLMALAGLGVFILIFRRLKIV